MKAAAREPGSITFRRAGVNDLPVYREIITEAQRWMWSRNINQWKEGFSDQFLADDIVNNQVILACAGSEVAGLCSLQEEELAWETFDGKALYLHRLTVRRSCSGQGLGAAILRQAENLAREKGKPFLRLDCWAGNEKLKEYYLKEGYSYKGNWREGDWMVSLFEKKL